MTKEEIYDQQIAPLLLQALKICKEHGMPINAAVYFNGAAADDSGLTTWHPSEKPNPCWYLMLKAWGACGNIDAMCMNISNELPDGVGESVVLRLLKP